MKAGTDSPSDHTAALASHPLCQVDIALDADAPVSLGRSPWRNRRISYIAGGERKADVVALLHAPRYGTMGLARS